MFASFSLRSTQTIAVLAVTQLVGWGTSFDMLGVMGRVIAPDLGLANEVVFGGLTVMMVVSALMGPQTGRWLSRYGAARVLAAASVIMSAGMLLLAAAHGIVLYLLAWIVIGIGGALCLTAPAYAAVVEREGPDSKRAITILMLFTGLSGTIFWPVLSLLNGQFGWRTTFVICAALHACICLPLYLFCLPKPVAGHTTGAAAEISPLPLSPVMKRKAFLLIAAATTISTFVTFGLSPSLLEVFRQSGASPALALQLGSARGVIGISARFMDMLLGKRGNPILTALIGIGMMVLSFVLLFSLPNATPVLVSFTLFYSFGAGLMAVARALLPLALFSAREYGLQSARQSLPQNLANATAPVVFTAILDRSGADAVIATCAVLAVVAFGFVAMLAALVREARSEAHVA